MALGKPSIGGAAGQSVQVVGLQGAIANVARIQAETSVTIRRGVQAGALLVQNSAKQKVPKVSGNLGRSIHQEVLSQSPSMVVVAVGTDVSYAARIEFGFTDTDSRGRSYNNPAQPYLRPALDENAHLIQGAIIKALNAMLAKRITG